jgi:hypothetical protein
MVSELGDLYALEVEASRFPEIWEEQAVRDIRFALLRATDAMSRLGSAAADPAIQTAREALDSAATASILARRLLTEAREARNRRS